MAHPFRIVCLVAVMVAAVSSCGESANAPASTSRPPTFPVTIKRTGGVAGFQDVVVVAGDGLVTVVRKGKPARSCQLTPGVFERLVAAASALPWSRITPASTDPSDPLVPDDMVTTVQSPAGGPVRVQDPLVGGTGQAFVELLSNLSNLSSGPGTSRFCAPL